MEGSDDPPTSARSSGGSARKPASRKPASRQPPASTPARSTATRAASSSRLSTSPSASPQALGVTLDELAGAPSDRIKLEGTWWAAWQTFNDGAEVIATQPVGLTQHGSTIQIEALERSSENERGGYLWRGELRLWDGQILMGYYAAADGNVRSKGTMYFVLHAQGEYAHGRWVGLSYDGPSSAATPRSRAPRSRPRPSCSACQRSRGAGMTDDLCEVIITAPDRDWLADLCRQLVDARLASSAHVVHPVTSIYRWEGAVHEATEARAFLRSRFDLVDALIAFVVERIRTRCRTSPRFRSSVAIPTTWPGFERRPQSTNRHADRSSGTRPFASSPLLFVHCASAAYRGRVSLPL